MSGLIFNIQRFSTKDGPGIRTTIYLKGCNLACVWCHNPESLQAKPQVQFFADKCTACGSCLAKCKRECHSLSAGRHHFNRSDCEGCGACAAACPREALTLCGVRKSVGEIVAVVERDRLYYENSGGGVTLSGGEPLLQPEFCMEVLKSCREIGISTALDTALNVSRRTLEKVFTLVNIWLVDVKHTDEDRYRQATGVSNRIILENLKWLLDSGGEVRVRVPVVQDITDDAENITKLAMLLSGKENVTSVELLPYHNYGIEKAKSLAMTVQGTELAPPTPENLTRLKEILRAKGIPCEN